MITSPSGFGCEPSQVSFLAFQPSSGAAVTTLDVAVDQPGASASSSAL